MMTRRQKRLTMGFFILTFLGVLFIFGKIGSTAKSQFYATAEKNSGNNINSACILEKEAQKYLDEIYKFSPEHFRVSKPKLIFDIENNPHIGEKIAVGKEDGKSITIFEKGFEELYGENCSETHLVRLQSTIAHEYAHHIDFNSGTIKKELKTTNLEYSAELGGEHALFELVWEKNNPKAISINAEEQKKIKELKKLLSKI